MANDELITDEYVADLLAKEAKDASAKYSAMGLDAFKSSRPSNKMKPNTRFLRHIIKETKNHNEALLAREAAESQARLQDLRVAEEKKRRRYKPESGDIRNRQLGDIAAILQGKKRKRAAEDSKEKEPAAGRGSAAGAASGEGSSSRKDRAGESHRSSRHARDRERSRSPGREKRHRRRSVDEDESRRHRHQRHRSSDEEEEDYRKEKRRRDRSRSPRTGRSRHRERSPARNDSETRDSRKRHHRRRSERDDGRLDRSTPPAEDLDDDADSDPLADIIGPAPPPLTRVRGRGAPGSSAMDSRFSDNYDPKSDLQPDTGGGDDWDDALEALRDRAKWRAQGAERLRAAGFTDDQVKKWETSGVEKDAQDVTWSRAGEKREWDRGKVLGDDGTIGHGAEWSK